MSERLYGVSRTDLRIRGGDGRTISGIAVPYDEPTEIFEAGGRYTEVFREPLPRRRVP